LHKPPPSTGSGCSGSDADQQDALPQRRPPERALQLNPGSYLAFLLWALLLVALLPDGRLGLLLALVVAFSWLGGGAGLRQVLASRRFWLFLLSTLAIAPFILGEADVRWGLLRLSRTGLETGLWMALRAATLMLAFSASLGALSVSQMIHLFDGLGLRGLGFALGVALNLGPVLRDTVEAAYHTLRLRGGLRRPVQAARLFLVTIIANGLRYGDDVVQAASARAFDPAARPARVTPILGRADKVFIVGLAAVGVGLVIAP
jgi:energy-coupling factor transporter transmembrane protein EcfT